MDVPCGQQADFSFEERAGEAAATLPRLLAWEPEQWPVSDDWQPVVSSFLKGSAASGLGRFVRARLAAGATVYPPEPFRALALTSRASVRVVILGQDPYHGVGQAQGLAFSVARGIAIPPSLRNIFKEIARDTAARGSATPISGSLVPANGALERWAEQGVLLLNTCLTVESGLPASHAKQGWEVLTDEIIKAVWSNSHPVVFMLWGAHAQAKKSLMVDIGGMFPGSDRRALGRSRHLVLTANHPSPLSALRPPQPFIGCGHFSLANAFLEATGQKPVAW